jgi:hypothetical protein
LSQNHETEIEKGKLSLTDLKITAILDSRHGMFLAVEDSKAYMHVETVRKHETGGYWARKGSVVAEQTEIYCARALYKRGETRSKKQNMIYTVESFWPL